MGVAEVEGEAEGAEEDSRAAAFHEIGLLGESESNADFVQRA